jgi:hypothetical protein
VLVVELVGYLAIATVVISALFYTFTRDRRYLRFIVQVVKVAIFLVAGVLLFFLLERLVLII